MNAPIYVVVASDDLNTRWRESALARDPDRKPNPIVFECNADGSVSLTDAQKRAAQFEASGYGPCRVGRVVFEDEPGFIPVAT
jgi:hypothetical protein